MSNQLDLFAVHAPLEPHQGAKPAPSPPARASEAGERMARRTDPSSSHAAAAKMRAEGKAATNRVLVEGYVCKWPGCTSKELSEKPGVTLDRHEIARRLPETEAILKSIRRVDAGKGEQLRWFPVEDAL